MFELNVARRISSTWVIKVPKSNFRIPAVAVFWQETLWVIFTGTLCRWAGWLLLLLQNSCSELHVVQIRKVNVEINQLYEKRMKADSSDDKLSLFRQQASTHSYIVVNSVNLAAAVVELRRTWQWERKLCIHINLNHVFVTRLCSIVSECLTEPCIPVSHIASWYCHHQSADSDRLGVQQSDCLCDGVNLAYQCQTHLTCALPVFIVKCMTVNVFIIKCDC